MKLNFRKMKFIVIFISLFFMTGCSNLLYYPTNIIYYPPEKVGVQHESFFIDVDKDTKINAWWVQTKNKKPNRKTIIFFHGNAQNVSSHYAALVWILKEGYDFVIWDYRGYGQSQGKPNPKNTVQDGVKVIEFVKNKFPKNNFFIFGQSLGGAIALRSFVELKDKSRIQAVIVESTFSSYRSVARNVLSKNWVTWLFQPLGYLLMNDEWAPKRFLQKISPTPLLVIHGTQDPIIDYKFGNDIYKKALEPKEFWTVDGGGHINAFFIGKGEYQKKFLEYLGGFN